MQLIPRLYDVSKAAEILGLRESTIRAWIFYGRVEVVRLGRRVKIPGTEIQRIIDEGRQPRRIV